MDGQLYAVTCRTWNPVTLQYDYLLFDVTYSADHAMQVEDETMHAFERAETIRDTIWMQ